MYVIIHSIKNIITLLEYSNEYWSVHRYKETTKGQGNQGII